MRPTRGRRRPHPSSTKNGSASVPGICTVPPAGDDPNWDGGRQDRGNTAHRGPGRVCASFWVRGPVLPLRNHDTRSTRSRLLVVGSGRGLEQRIEDRGSRIGDRGSGICPSPLRFRRLVGPEATADSRSIMPSRSPRQPVEADRQDAEVQRLVSRDHAPDDGGEALAAGRTEDKLGRPSPVRSAWVATETQGTAQRSSRATPGSPPRPWSSGT